MKTFYLLLTDSLTLIFLAWNLLFCLLCHSLQPGHTPLSWIMRVQIALDAGRGLEYIHKHTKPHYVHRDIKTSNILLDDAFRAKISDFGLSKLIGITNDGEASATRVVGTYGYVAPD